MALPAVKFQFVAGGVNDVKKALRSISTALKDIDKQYDTLKKKEKSALSSFKNDLNNKSKEIKKHLQQEVRDYQKAASDKLRIERRLNETIARTRKAGSSPLSSNVGGGFKGMPGGGGFSLGSLSNTAKTIGGLAVVGVAAKAISMAFDQLKSVALDLAGALVTLGGGFTIADSFIKAVQGKRTAVNIETSAGSPEERVAAGEVLKFTEGQIAKGSEFKQSDWLKGIKQYQTLTGNAKEFIDGLGEFAAEMATVTGSSLDDMATFMAQIKLQFKDMTPEQLKDTTMKLWQSGKQGAIELNDTKAIGEVTSLAHQLQGEDKVKNIAAVVGTMQITRPVAGSSAETSTATQRFFANTQANRKTIEAKTGIKFGDKEGKINMVDSLLAAGRFVEKDNVAARKAYGIEGYKTASAVANITRGKSDEEARRLIEAFTDVEASALEFSEALNKNKETADYSLKAMFGKLEMYVGDALSSALGNSIQSFDSFSEKITDSIPAIVTIFEILVAITEALGDSFGGLGSIIAVFGSKLLDIMAATKMITKDEAQKGKRNIENAERNAAKIKEERDEKKRLAKLTPEEREAEEQAKADKKNKDLIDRAAKNNLTVEQQAKLDRYNDQSEYGNGKSFEMPKEQQQLVTSIQDAIISTTTAGPLMITEMLGSYFAQSSQTFNQAAKAQETAATKQQLAADAIRDTIQNLPFILYRGQGNGPHRP